VRAVRRGSQVVQEAVAPLGELEADGRANARLLAQQITGAEQQQRELFEAAASAEQRIAVRLAQVCLARARWFGGVWLGWKWWRALKLDELWRRADASWPRSDPRGPDGGGVGNRAPDRSCQRTAHC